MGSGRCSVIITAYNYHEYVKEAVQSCLSQAALPLEIIVVDDGSNPPIDVPFAQNVRLVRHSENKGYAVAKNTGILASKGEFIRMLDADDVLTQNSLMDALETFDKHPEADLVHGICARWYGGKDIRGYNKKTYVHAQGRMYRRSVYERFGLYYEPLKSMADKEFVYRLGVHPDSPLPRLIKDVRIKNVVALYRKHDNQMHKIRRKRPLYNAKVKSMFKQRIKQLKREGITRENTRFAII